MDENVAKAGEPSPINLRLPREQSVVQLLYRFADNRKAVNDSVLIHRGLHEGVATDGCIRFNSLYAVENIRAIQALTSCHNGSASFKI